MPGFDEATPPPPRDPAVEAARLERRRELVAKVEALEARAAAMTTSPPPSGHADSDEANSDVACNHEWVAYDRPGQPVTDAANVRICRNCTAFTWDISLMPLTSDNAGEERKPVMIEFDNGQRWVNSGHGWMVLPFKEPVPLALEHLDPVANLRAVQEWAKGRYLGVEPRAYAEGGVISPSANAEDCPKCSGKNLPYPWICKGHPEAYARAMDLARGQEAEDRLDAFRVALTRGERWPLDRMSDDALDLLYAELDHLRERGNPETWERQASTLVKQAKELGVLHDKIRERDAAARSADKAVATVARIKAMAARWQYVPGKKDAAKDILAAIGSDDTPEQP